MRILPCSRSAYDTRTFRHGPTSRSRLGPVFELDSYSFAPSLYLFVYLIRSLHMYISMPEFYAHPYDDILVLV